MKRIIIASVLALGACGGDSGSTADAGSTSDSDAGVKRVFVTASQFSGNLGGVAGADAICQGAATAHSLGGSWVAWISTSTANARDRVTGAGPWYLLDGTTLVFSSHAQLMGSPLVGILQDETGATIDPMQTSAGDLVVHTGTSADGTAGDTCVNFTSSSANDMGTYGFIDLTSDWTDFASGQCDSSNGRLYCFEL